MVLVILAVLIIAGLIFNKKRKDKKMANEVIEARIVDKGEK